MERGKQKALGPEEYVEPGMHSDEAAKQEEKSKGVWEKQEGAGFWKPEKKGDELIGEVVDIKEGTYGTQYVIEKEDGESVVCPSWKVLLNRMSNANKGDMVKIVYQGEEAPKVRGNRPTKLFDAFIKRV
jgi:hypothetical protein